MQPDQVPADLAYAAAEESACRTTKALILAEAQVLTLQQTVRELGEETTRLARELERAESVTAETKRLMQRRTETLRRRAEAAEGVTHDGATDDGADAGGEAGQSHPFHD